MNWIFSLQKSISKLIFVGYTGSKNPVQNRLKIQFVKLDFSKLIFQKSSMCRKIDILHEILTYLRIPIPDAISNADNYLPKHFYKIEIKRWQ